MVQIKRIYDEPNQDDGYRILVDRLWPRGVSKGQAAIDLWLKEVAPSPELRTWFGHKPEQFTDFKHRYTEELSNNPATAELLKRLADSNQNVTLLYGAKDPAINHAVVLQQFLEKQPQL
jgi:uncharacterized protein YeaO (DUF488 family)